MRYEAILGQVLKKLKDTKGFIEKVGLSQSLIYFKIGLFKKYPALKNSSLSSHYFRNDFKMFKTVSKNSEELFT